MKSFPPALCAISLLLQQTLTAADSAAIRATLTGSGDPDATGLVIVALGHSHSDMIVQAKNLDPSHTYAVEVAGIVEANVTTDKSGRAGLRFRTPAQKHVPVLDFDPQGATLRFLDDGTSVLEGTIGAVAAPAQVDERVELSAVAAPSKARAQARFTLNKQGRSTFRVDVSNPGTQSVDVLVDGVNRGTLDLRGKNGTLTFDSEPKHDSTPLLDFDPRGLTVDLVSAGAVLFSDTLQAQVPRVNMAMPSVTQVALTPQSAAGAGTAVAKLRLDDRARKHFSLEVENVPAGDYDLAVADAVVATITVEATSTGTAGELELATNDDL
jgi:hypothetical protein